MKRYRVFVPIVRWAEWLVNAENEEDACLRILEGGEGKEVGNNDSSEVGEGTYATEVDDES